MGRGPSSGSSSACTPPSKRSRIQLKTCSEQCSPIYTPSPLCDDVLIAPVQPATVVSAPADEDDVEVVTYPPVPFPDVVISSPPRVVNVAMRSSGSSGSIDSGRTDATTPRMRSPKADVQPSSPSDDSAGVDLGDVEYMMLAQWIKHGDAATDMMATVVASEIFIRAN